MRRTILAVGALTAVTGCGTAAREAAPAMCVVRIYFCTVDACARAASKRQIITLSRRLGTDDDVYSVRFVSKLEALRIMKKRYPAETARLRANPFPDSLRVRPVKGVEPQAIASKVDMRRDGVHAVKLPRSKACG